MASGKGLEKNAPKVVIKSAELGRHRRNVALQGRDLLHLLQEVASHGVLRAWSDASGSGRRRAKEGKKERTLRSMRKRMRSRCSASQTVSSSKHCARRTGSVTAYVKTSALVPFQEEVRGRGRKVGVERTVLARLHKLLDADVARLGVVLARLEVLQVVAVDETESGLRAAWCTASHGVHRQRRRRRDSERGKEACSPGRLEVGLDRLRRADDLVQGRLQVVGAHLELGCGRYERQCDSWIHSRSGDRRGGCG